MPSFFEEVVGRLVQQQAEFVIVGGMSAVLQGAPVVTRDLDICYRRTPQNIARVVSALRALNPRARGLPADLPFFFDERTLQLGSNFTPLVGNEELDLLGVMGGIGNYDQIIDGADEMEVAGLQVHVLSLEQLIATKEFANRPKDHATLPILRATLQTQRRDEAGDG